MEYTFLKISDDIKWIEYLVFGVTAVRLPIQEKLRFKWKEEMWITNGMWPY